MIKILLNGNECEIKDSFSSLEYEITAGENLSQWDVIDYLGLKCAEETKSLGVVTTNANMGETVKVVTSGTAKCRIEVDVTAGNKLTAVAGLNGTMKKATGSMLVNARSLQTGTAGDTIDCLIVA